MCSSAFLCISPFKILNPAINNTYHSIVSPTLRMERGGLQNGALTEHFSDLKSLDLGVKIRDPNYTPGVDFWTMIICNLLRGKLYSKFTISWSLSCSNMVKSQPLCLKSQNRVFPPFWSPPWMEVPLKPSTLLQRTDGHKQNSLLCSHPTKKAVSHHTHTITYVGVEFENSSRKQRYRYLR